MTTVFLIASIICGGLTVTTIVLFFLSLCFDDACYWLLLCAVILGMLTWYSLDSYQTNVKQESKEIVITTNMPAKIDTTIIIKNGVSDTTYTYYLMEK